jgi:hypothetical protein
LVADGALMHVYVTETSFVNGARGAFAADPERAHGRFGEDGIRLPLALTRREVADLIGFTQETA